MSDEDDRTTAYEEAYREAIRALELQRAAFDTIRTRTGILLSAGVVATSFFGSRDLDQGRADVWTWFALFLFLGVGAACLRVLWPRAEGPGGFSASPSAFIEAYIEPDEGEPLTLAQLYRESALHAEDQLDRNEREHFKELTGYFRAAVLLLMGESAVWVVALAAS